MGAKINNPTPGLNNKPIIPVAKLRPSELKRENDETSDAVVLRPTLAPILIYSKTVVIK